ncbi:MULTISPECIES: hypothetical protein [unclassified Cyanobium]|uniref:hypothetical protein n=1 Tax=unclassified Cyanobium TaxID=2627006 RepID=UPI0020CCD4A3|nr:MULTISPECIES: hypothetical protein [unclassified Cyanobium]MCP9777207.1 hypothetical protein [Cyanobium sp. Tous-M-B4]MCP9876872.1 hypothetical protein [Cyanobium sp. A2C-AMD]
MSARIRPALDSLLHGLISLGLGALLAAFILVGASQQGGQGNSQLAADSLRMLWSPAIFAGVGVLLIANGLLRCLWLLLKRQQRAKPVLVRPVLVRSTPGRTVATEPAVAELAPPPPDAYRRACAELGVEPGSDWALVRSAWRRNLPQWHPDQGGALDVWRRKLAAYTLLEAWQQFEEPR